LWREILMVNDGQGLQEASLTAHDRAGWRNTIRAIEDKRERVFSCNLETFLAL